MFLVITSIQFSLGIIALFAWSYHRWEEEREFASRDNDIEFIPGYRASPPPPPRVNMDRIRANIILALMEECHLTIDQLRQLQRLHPKTSELISSKMRAEGHLEKAISRQKETA